MVFYGLGSAAGVSAVRMDSRCSFWKGVRRTLKLSSRFRDESLNNSSTYGGNRGGNSIKRGVPVFRRGQASIEMFLFVGLLLVALMIFSALSFARARDFAVGRDFIEAKSVARAAAMEINSAIIVGPGYAREFELPESLFGGTPYVLRTIPSEQLVEITWGESGFFVPLLSSNVSEATLANGKNTLSNNGGLISFA